MARITALRAGGVEVLALLDTVAVSEIGHDLLAASDDGYDVIVGGATFHDYTRHPRIAVRTRFGLSDAAGRYQIMAAIPGKIVTDTWDWAHRIAGVHDFSPISQDLTCVYLFEHRGAMAPLRAGKVADAITRCANEWASLPGSPYGQGTNSMATLLNVYEVALAKYKAAEGSSP